MSCSDPLSDMLTRIRNAQTARKPNTLVPASAMHRRVLDVLVRNGYISGHTEGVENSEKPDHRASKMSGKQPTKKTSGATFLTVKLKYHNGEPAIVRLARVSRPGRRIYTNIRSLPRVSNGLGMSILSTSQGVMSDHEARVSNIGGEILCEVF